MTYYITEGTVRGRCNHKHKTYGSAEACAEKDQRDVRRGNPGGTAYSDRRVYAVEGAYKMMGKSE